MTSPSSTDQVRKCNWADALSRCPVRASQEIKLDMRIDYIAFTKPWIEKLKDSMQRDPS